MKHIELDRLRTALEQAQAEDITAMTIFQRTITARTAEEPTPLESILTALHGFNVVHERYRLALKRYNEAVLKTTQIA